MINKKNAGIVVLVVGIVILAVSLLADAIGIGESSGIGRDQLMAIIGGVVLTVVGLVLIFTAKSPGPSVPGT